MNDSPRTGVDRRTFLRVVGAGAGAVAASGALASCGLIGSSTTLPTDVLKIGLVSPQTGPLASFASADNFVVEQIQTALAKGFTAGGRTRQIQIVVKDTQSSPTRATQVTKSLITDDKVDIVVASGTPDTTNPVADECEASGVPNISAITPWEVWFFGRNGVPGTGFKYSTMFYYGIDQFAECFFPMWERIGATSKSVAALWPDDSDANAFRVGLGTSMKKAGYTVVDGGAYADGTTNFSSQIATFKDSGAELFTCTPIPPDFQAYWKQAVQLGFRPKLATVAKVMLFPAEANALGDLSNNIATDIWWSPFHPYKSVLDGRTAKKLADDFATASGHQWTQALGSVYSLFEVAIQAFKNATDPKDKEDVAHQLQTMKIDCMSGSLDFTAGPQPGIALLKPVGGQWRPGKKFAWDIQIVDNSSNTVVPITGDLLPTFA